MNKKLISIISVILCFSLLLTGSAIGTSAVQTQEETSFGDSAMKGLYNTLNIIVEGLVKSICSIYIDPPDWESIDNYDSE